MERPPGQGSSEANGEVARIEPCGRPRAARSRRRALSAYDAIAGLYDAWSRTVVEDVPFYVEEARKAGGTVVELGVGTGRVAIPVARAGIAVIGVDSSPGMLDVCRKAAAEAGVADLVDLRLGHLEAPPVGERVRLVTSPFRAFLHLPDEAARLRALRAVHELLLPRGHFVFDVFAPGRDDIEETHGRWLEREPGIWERADWDEQRQVLTLSVRGDSGETTMALAWLEPDGWQTLIEEAGFAVVSRFGWFDRRPYRGGEDVVWVAERPA